MMQKLEAIIESTEYLQVRRRVFRQLIESLIFENIVNPVRTAVQDGIEQFMIYGQDQFGDPVTYVCHGKQKMSFERIRLTNDPILRKKNAEEAEVNSFSLFFEEIAPFIDADQKRLAMFITELNETHLKDATAQYEWQRSDQQKTMNYDEIESEAMEGHPYHPSYKSRIGFTIEDDINYGPDFKPSLSLFWLAVHKEQAIMSFSQSVNYEEFMKQEIGPKVFDRFVKKIQEKNQVTSDFLFIPVHPWQWKNVVITQFFREIEMGNIILLGEGSDEYIPQQSIRTLANKTEQTKCYVKLPLSITNTSTNRVLAPHTVENAAIISDWLSSIKERDNYLKNEFQLVFLREVMGVSFNTGNFSSFEKESAYGVLGSIWRESIHSYLKKGEDAIPFNALYHCKKDRTSLVEGWVSQYGVEDWVKQLLHVSITPLIHLLYSHGIAMESHAQNMILIHENGWPTRLALKDFHDGIRFKKEELSHQELYPNLISTPESHKKINRNSFIETDQLDLVRDFFHDAFFFINLSELAFFFEENYGLKETEFWNMACIVIESYQTRFSHLSERFKTFNLFSETIQVEQLTKRRMYPETELRIQHVKNPLFKVREVTTC